MALSRASSLPQGFFIRHKTNVGASLLAMNDNSVSAPHTFLGNTTVNSVPSASLELTSIVP